MNHTVLQQAPPIRAPAACDEVDPVQAGIILIVLRMNRGNG